MNQSVIQCPYCDSIFSVVTENLSQRKGLFRCEKCFQVINGFDHLAKDQTITEIQSKNHTHKTQHSMDKSSHNALNEFEQHLIKNVTTAFSSTNKAHHFTPKELLSNHFSSKEMALKEATSKDFTLALGSADDFHELFLAQTTTAPVLETPVNTPLKNNASHSNDSHSNDSPTHDFTTDKINSSATEKENLLNLDLFSLDTVAPHNNPNTQNPNTQSLKDENNSTASNTQDNAESSRHLAQSNAGVSVTPNPSKTVNVSAINSESAINSDSVINNESSNTANPSIANVKTSNSTLNTLEINHPKMASATTKKTTNTANTKNAPRLALALVDEASANLATKATSQPPLNLLQSDQSHLDDFLASPNPSNIKSANERLLHKTQVLSVAHGSKLPHNSFKESFDDRVTFVMPFATANATKRSHRTQTPKYAAKSSNLDKIPLKSIISVLALVFLLLLIIGQYIYFNFYKLYTNPVSHALIMNVCKVIKCSAHEFDAFNIAIKNIKIESENINSDISQIKFSLTNINDQMQPYPALRLSTTNNLNQESIVLVQPKEYLTVQNLQKNDLHAQEVINGSFNVKLKKTNISKYNITPVYWF